MGQTSSVPKQSRKRSLRSPFLRRSASQKAPISHTFQLMDDDQKLEQLNINIATEEELMTLPEVNREIARNIVEYRKAIGRFRKIEDLALVRGIGAEKFEIMKGEVCVKNNSCNSSRSQSYDSLSVENRLTPRPNNKRLIDINNASVFELQCVPGMTQEMAANILHYRIKKGGFKKIEDLLKVKGFDNVRFSNIRHHLTLETVSRSTSDILSNGGCNGTIPVNRHRKTSSAPIKFNISNGLLQSSLNDIFELLSAYSPRPLLTEEFSYRRNNRDAVRIATWNLHEFTSDKAQNLGVKEVVCRTILENGWSIVCFQEIEDQNALQILCDELNYPKLRRISECKQNSRQWHFCMLESHQAILYDVHSGGKFLVSLTQTRSASI
ncbi:hypothetical protein QE152_g21528 [Popillia japonica]|uniref:Endonuclease/exonuclease/phosphatase family domain-containing protein 1 n=1 Tax=Popillia japonica TaxID=7064 RepID=A0AAW1KPV6_POPJA